MTSGSLFAEKTCSAPAERSDQMRDLVLAHAPRDRPIRLLDLGCGTGALLFRLAEALPNASLTGIDISVANIQAARAQRDGPEVGRVGFEVADYREFTTDPFDVIVTDGVLHLIPGDTTTLFEKLARDLVPGGLLVCNMPYNCAYNRAFAVLRIGLARIRSNRLDKMILGVGRLLHGRDMDDRRLLERVEYMYLPPTRMLDRAIRDRIAPQAGLRAIAGYPMESTSLAQLKHGVTVFRRA